MEIETNGCVPLVATQTAALAKKVFLCPTARDQLHIEPALFGFAEIGAE